MKDLNTMSDIQLIEYYKEMEDAQYTDYSMDGSGDCSSMIAETWRPVWEAFEKEFEKRDINVMEQEMPY